MKDKSISWPKLCSGIFMVFGTTVGAGMLGIPAVTADAGFWPAILVTLLVWIFMAITGLLLLEATLKMPSGANFISLSRRFLGRFGGWFSGALFLFLYYSLLVAYFAGGAPLLGQMLSWVGLSFLSLTETSLFALFFGGVIVLGVSWINRVNLILTFGMLAAYVLLVLLGSGAVNPSRFSESHLLYTVGAVPVLFSAFGFHNVVPPLATYLERDKKVLRLSIIGGTFLAFALYVVWQWLVLGSIPKEALDSARAEGLPITYALQAASSGGFVYVAGQVFAFLALTTSFLGVGFSFVHFIQDGFKEGGYQVSRLICALLTLIPPFLCVLFIPHLFEKALGVAGGFGESILNGILPVMLFAKMRSLSKDSKLGYGMKAFLVFLVLLSLGVILVEAVALLF